MPGKVFRDRPIERYVFRPWGEFALFGFAIFVLLFTGVSARDPGARPSREVSPRLPTLSLSVAGDFQQAVHFNVDQDGGMELRSAPLVAPRHAVRVSPQDWVRIYTNSPLGLPRSARAHVYLSARPEPCFGNVMIGCVDVDIDHESFSIPLHLEGSAGFGFEAPAKPGSYWIALQADWEFGGGTQVFVIDVRA